MYPQSSQNFICPPNALAWAETLLAEKVVSIKQLIGSTSAVLFDLESESGRQTVLRLFTLDSWLKIEPDLARHEAAVLDQVEKIEVSTPVCLGYDEFGVQTTHPAVLMTKLPGQVDINPTDPSGWIVQQAVALARIHQAPMNDFAWQYKHWFDYSEMVVPPWSQAPNAWAKLIKFLESPQPVYQPVLLHRDYHPTNILWQDGKISGVVDWVNGCIGPAMVDVAHCRLNLASLFGVHTADAFLEAWVQEVGEANYSLWWDICGLANGNLFESHPLGVYRGWGDFGRNDITIDILAKNLDDFAISLGQSL